MRPIGLFPPERSWLLNELVARRPMRIDGPSASVASSSATALPGGSLNGRFAKSLKDGIGPPSSETLGAPSRSVTEAGKSVRRAVNIPLPVVVRTQPLANCNRNALKSVIPPVVANPRYRMTAYSVLKSKPTEKTAKRKINPPVKAKCSLSQVLIKAPRYPPRPIGTLNGMGSPKRSGNAHRDASSKLQPRLRPSGLAQGVFRRHTTPEIGSNRAIR